MSTTLKVRNRIDFVGGIGSILTAGMCVGIGWIDFGEGRSWRIWAVMTLVLLVNGVAMLVYANRVLQEMRAAQSPAPVLRARL